MGQQCCNDNSCCDQSCSNNGILSSFFSIPPVQFSLLSALIGALLIDSLTADEQNSLGNFFINVGQMLVTSAAQEATISGGTPLGRQYSQKIQSIRGQLDALEAEMKGK